jgi:hypothetical protein
MLILWFHLVFLKNVQEVNLVYQQMSVEILWLAQWMKQ